MGTWTEVACLPVEWAPSQDWGEVEVMAEALVEALYEIRKSLNKQVASMVAGTISWLFLTVLRPSKRRTYSCEKHKKR